MKSIYINFPSVTYALKSERILNNLKIKNKLVRTPSDFSPCGCGYSILVDDENIDAIISALKKASITINDIREI